MGRDKKELTVKVGIMNAPISVADLQP